MTIVYIPMWSIVNTMMEIDPERLAVVGARVRDAREARGETQAQAARSIGVDRTYLGRLELGQKNITLAVLYSIADHYGVEAKSLLAD